MILNQIQFLIPLLFIKLTKTFYCLSSSLLFLNFSFFHSFFLIFSLKINPPKHIYKNKPMKQSLLLFSKLHPLRALFTRPLFAFSDIGAAEKTLLSKRLAENESKLKEMFSQVTENTNFSQAIPLIEESISLKKKIFGENTTEIHVDYFNMGFIKTVESKYQESIHYFEQSLAINPTLAHTFEVLTSLSISYLKSKDMPNASKYLDLALKSGREFEKTLDAKSKEFMKYAVKMTNLYMNLIMLTKAQKQDYVPFLMENKAVIEKTLAHTPIEQVESENFSMYLCEIFEELAQIRFSKQQKMDLEDNQKLLAFGEKTKNNIILSRAYFQKGFVLSMQGDQEGTIENYKMAKSQFEKRSAVTTNLLNYYLMIFTSLAQQYLKARKFNEGYDLIAEFNAFHEQHKVFNDAIVLQMQNVSAELLSAEGKKTEALVILRASLEKGEELESKFHSEAASRTKKETELRFDVERMLGFKERNLRLHCGIYYELKKFDDALKYFAQLEKVTQQLVTIKPEAAGGIYENWGFKGIVMFRMGKMEDAIKCYEKAIEGFRNIPEKRMELDKCYAELGFIAEKYGDKKKAFANFKNSYDLRLT